VARAEKSIVVRVPVRTAFRWWTTYEEFPEFLDGVVRVSRGEDGTLHWEVDIDGHREQWDAFVSKEDDHRVAWHTMGRPPHAGGEVELRPVEGGQTLVTLRMEYHDQHLHDVEGAAAIVDRMVANSLERFKAFAEPREPRRVLPEDAPAPLGAETVNDPSADIPGDDDPDAGSLPFSEHGRRWGPPAVARDDGEVLLREVDDAEPTHRVGTDDLGAETDPRLAGDPRVDLDANEDDNQAEWSRSR
jgi:hypothetical protein